MGCFLEIAMAAWGLYMISTGETKSPVGKPIRGGLVRVAGFIFMMPFPLSFLVGFSYGFSAGIKGHTSLSKSDVATLQLVEMALIFGCLVVGSGVVFLASMSESEPKGEPHSPDRLLGDYDRVFEHHPKLERPLSELDEVLPVGPNPPALSADQKYGVTAARPPVISPPRPTRQRPDMDPAKGYGALLQTPGQEPRDDAPPKGRPIQEAPAGARPRTAARKEQPPDRKQSVLMFVAAGMLFLVVAGAGAALMWSNDKSAATTSPELAVADQASAKPKGHVDAEANADDEEPAPPKPAPKPRPPRAVKPSKPAGPDYAPGELSRLKLIGMKATASSQDGRWFVCMDDARSIQVWHAADGRKVTEFACDIQAFEAMEISSDGRTLLFLESPQGPAYVRSVRTGGPPVGFTPRLDGVISASFSPDGSHLAVVGQEEIWVYQSHNGRPRILRHKPTNFSDRILFRSIRYTPDGQQLLTCSHPPSGVNRDVWTFWDLETGRPVGTIPGPPAGRAANVYQSGNGRFVAWTGTDRALEWCDRRGSAKLRRATLPERPASAAFSPDGRTLALGLPEGRISFWDLEKGEQISEFTVRNEARAQSLGLKRVEHLAFSADGRKLHVAHDLELSVWEMTRTSDAP